jgi:hypothetical protein
MEETCDGMYIIPYESKLFFHARDLPEIFKQQVSLRKLL